MSELTVLRVRIIDTDSWVGKDHPMSAFVEASGGRIDSWRSLSWWVPERRAKVWNTVGQLRQIVSMGRKNNNLMPSLEVVFGDGTIKPLDEVCPPAVPSEPLPDGVDRAAAWKIKDSPSRELAVGALQNTDGKFAATIWRNVPGSTRGHQKPQFILSTDYCYLTAAQAEKVGNDTVAQVRRMKIKDIP